MRSSRSVVNSPFSLSVISGCMLLAATAVNADATTDALVQYNSTHFYSPSILLQSLPDLPADKAAYARVTFDSYKNASAKGNDAWSTKRLDLVRFYDEIRYGDATVWKEYTGTASVYADSPVWQMGGHNMGILNKQWQSNALDFYNFYRALMGASRVYTSGYKTVAAQVAAMSGLPGAHYPTAADGIAAGMIGPMFDAIYKGRSAACLVMGTVDKTANYAAMTMRPANQSLAGIWSEAANGSIAGLGHRSSFMTAAQRDIGFGAVKGYTAWETYGSDPTFNDGELLGAVAESAIYNSWPAGQSTENVSVWPSHGYFPFFALKNSNQGFSLRLPKSMTGVSAPVSGEIVTLKMELFAHSSDGDLTQLSAPIQTIELVDTVGVKNSGRGPVNPTTGVPDYINAEQIAGGASGPQYVQGGGYYFTATGGNFPLKWRIPQNWYSEMATNFASATPKYYTVRFTFSSNGNGYKVLKPFYMNNTVGAPLVIQTTYFDIKTQNK